MTSQKRGQSPFLANISSKCALTPFTGSLWRTSPVPHDVALVLHRGLEQLDQRQGALRQPDDGLVLLAVTVLITGRRRRIPVRRNAGPEAFERRKRSESIFFLV
jgi:hypothetical protein